MKIPRDVSGEKLSAREKIERDRNIIKKFMENYGEEWKKRGED